MGLFKGETVQLARFIESLDDEDFIGLMEGAAEEFENGGVRMGAAILREGAKRIKRHLDSQAPCADNAIIHHGPGHQTKSKCEAKGPHDVHWAAPMGEMLRWRGDEAFTGAFDESPLVDE